MLYEPIVEDSSKEEDKFLLEHFTSPFRSGFGLFGEGKYCMPNNYKDIYETIHNFEVRDDDVYVISFPKAGTTWTQEMIWLIGNNLDYEGAKKLLIKRFPFLELQGLGPRNAFTVLKKENPETNEGEQVWDSVNYTSKTPSPRFIKTHLPWELLPKQITSGEKKPKIIYTARNVKDCIVSFYHHKILIEGYQGSFDDLFKIFIADRVYYAPFWSHILEYWKRRHWDNVLFLKYEEMKKDLPSVIRRVSTFFGKEYTEEDVLKLADHLSFDNMKNNPAVNNEFSINFNKKSGFVKPDVNYGFIRSGVVGEHKVCMSEKQIQQINEISIKAVKNTDYEL